MSTPTVSRARILFVMLMIVAYFPIIGCNDESKTSGTMVERSEEAKAHMKNKVESYKGGRAKSKDQVKAPSAKK